MMFGKKNNEHKFSEPLIESFGTIIGSATEFHGSLIVSESVRVDGKIFGNIEERAGQRITIAIGKGGEVYGDIFAFRILVAGMVNGNTYAHERVELHTTANVHGDVTYDTIGIEPGATLNGQMISKRAEPNSSPDSATQLQDTINKIKQDAGISS
ncbi:polymer-forming cytoskeletal protein [Polynucleobacter paneuropaeus]|nr:polymer-forming cytoskeletal protein [Polynucleobacter paneuropaeus]